MNWNHTTNVKHPISHLQLNQEKLLISNFGGLVLLLCCFWFIGHFNKVVLIADWP